MRHHFVVHGKPVSQKNSKDIAYIKDIHAKNGLRPIIVSNKKVKAWRKEALKQLKAQWGNKPPIVGDLAVIVQSFKGKRQRPDVDGLLPAPLDALKEAGIVEDDKIFSLALSIRDVDNDNPRVEIDIVPADSFECSFGKGGA